MKPVSLVIAGLVAFAVYSVLRSWGRSPGPIIVKQVPPDYLPGFGAAPPGMEWDVNFAGEWVPVVAKL